MSSLTYFVFPTYLCTWALFSIFLNREIPESTESMVYNISINLRFKVESNFIFDKEINNLDAIWIKSYLAFCLPFKTK